MVRKAFSLVWRLIDLLRRDPPGAWLALRLAWWVAAVSVLARLLPLPRALRIITPARASAATRPPLSAVNKKRLVELLDLVLSIDLLFWTPVCWKRAAVLHRYFELAGVDSRIVFGVRHDERGALDGHAWLEVAGQPVFETTPPKYTPTFYFPHPIANRS